MNKEQRKAWRTANPEKHRAEQRLYYSRNLETCRSKTNRNRHKYSIVATQNRRARKTQAGGHFTTGQWLWLCRAAGFKCICCDKRKPLQADHVIPISKGGTSWIWNIQPLCKKCNQQKHTKIIDYRF